MNIVYISNKDASGDFGVAVFFSGCGTKEKEIIKLKIKVLNYPIILGISHK